VFATTLGCTYLGVALCYVASSSSASDIGEGMRASVSPGWFRAGGLLLMTVGLSVAVGTRPSSEGVLVWLSVLIAAGSLLVIAAPLVDYFVSATGTLAALIGVLGLWL
jgi:hypothetical protein